MTCKRDVSLYRYQGYSTGCARAQADHTSGIGENQPGLLLSGSHNVICNGRQKFRQSDPANVTLGLLSQPAQPGVAVYGSPSVITNGRGQCRVLDVMTDGDVIASGSPNVIIGGMHYPLTASAENTAMVTSNREPELTDAEYANLFGLDPATHTFESLGNGRVRITDQVVGWSFVRYLP